MTMKHQLHIDQLFKVWQENVVEIEFNGTKEELEAALKEKKGDISEFEVEYLSSENLIDSEEYLDKYEIQSIEEA
jgi:formate dehydrogenase assembly factor FdhD